jgi:hypothetical protein
MIMSDEQVTIWHGGAVAFLKVLSWQSLVETEENHKHFHDKPRLQLLDKGATP